ncbi:unnamed protein product, partial [Rotaria sp. Silwood1]
LHQLQKQIQKYSINNNNESPITIRRGSAVPSPTNSTILHIIREEHHNPFHIHLYQDYIILRMMMMMTKI